MKTLYNGDTFTQNGETFRVNFEHDDAGYPWESCDGHGNVREISANGDLTIGCHFIPFSEVAIIAKKLGMVQA
jgi:hypothetical protein